MLFCAKHAPDSGMIAVKIVKLITTWKVDFSDLVRDARFQANIFKTNFIVLLFTSPYLCSYVCNPFGKKKIVQIKLIVLLWEWHSCMMPTEFIQRDHQGEFSSEKNCCW